MKRTLNTTINRSKNEKNDEHYTQLSDIEDEVRHYRPQFAGKTVLCNCDDPRSSNFFKYFTRSFEILGLKRVIATCYKSQDVDLFTAKKCEKAVYQIYDGDTNRNNEVDDAEIAVKELQGDGSFDSPECLKLLDEADIVVTKRTGIIPYLLTGDERHLSIRAFDDDEKLAAYTRQGGKCPKCGKHFAIEEMQADHITPWAKGGKTVAENCQMLCADCNRRKSDA